ncbi:hypothetical protein Taro_039357 [Colocasia esculenta]|uniref:peroxidase n=1 Tax=Colocasia esculenta TaxID=4460 RepID=A0A843W682_COLES|nr:hypothetical protein [Colocasia esculenta]
MPRRPTPGRPRLAQCASRARAGALRQPPSIPSPTDPLSLRQGGEEGKGKGEGHRPSPGAPRRHRGGAPVAAGRSPTMSGGLRYLVRSGRRDGRISKSSETLTSLPPSTFNLAQLTQNFARKGLSQEDMGRTPSGSLIALASAVAYTTSARPSRRTRSSLNNAYAEQLKSKCPKGSTDPELSVPLDPPSPEVFDSSYYKGILAHRGLFQSDRALMSSSNTARQVIANAYNEYLFKDKFAEAMVKMGKIGVLTQARWERYG